MNKSSETGAVVNAEFLIQQMRQKGFTDALLYEKSQVSVRNIWNMRNGVRVGVKSIHLVANALDLTYEAMISGKIAEAERPSQPFVYGKMKLPIPSKRSFTAEEALALIKRIQKVIADEGAMEICDTQYGSVILTIKMSPEQLEAMSRAFKEGKLAQLGITEFTQVSGPRPRWKRFNYRWILGGVSIACSLAGLFPTMAVPFYLIGLLAGIGCVMVSRGRQVWSFVLPAIAIVANTLALIAWPKTLGFYEGVEGYRLKFGDRSHMLEDRGHSININLLGSDAGIPLLAGERRPDVEGKYKVIYDGNEKEFELRFKPTGIVGDFYQYPAIPDGLGLVILGAGRHSITLIKDGLVVFNKTVFLDANSGNVDLFPDLEGGWTLENPRPYIATIAPSAKAFRAFKAGDHLELFANGVLKNRTTVTRYTMQNGGAALQITQTGGLRASLAAGTYRIELKQNGNVIFSKDVKLNRDNGYVELPID